MHNRAGFTQYSSFSPQSKNITFNDVQFVKMCHGAKIQNALSQKNWSYHRPYQNNSRWELQHSKRSWECLSTLHQLILIISQSCPNGLIHFSRWNLKTVFDTFLHITHHWKWHFWIQGWINYIEWNLHGIKQI